MAKNKDSQDKIVTEAHESSESQANPLDTKMEVTARFVRNYAKKFNVEIPDSFPDTEPENMLAFLVNKLNPPKPLSVVVRDEQQEDPGLGVLSILLGRVDNGVMTMPQARQKLAEWWNKQDKAKVGGPVRDRMRRLSQITDALREQLWTLVGSGS